MEAGRFFESVAPIRQSTRRHVTDGWNITPSA